ncbi:MAG: tetratricopeptide repeat protein, partial [Anaerolineae bacterium]|nr:tetratricopeptide repeat protein [Anaerolineae bacterium]
RSMVNSQLGNIKDAADDLQQAQKMADPQVRWETLLAEAQLFENSGKCEQAADNYRRMMALKPGDHRARLLLADLYRRSGNTPLALNEYRAIIQARPSVGAAYIGASKAYLFIDQLENAIKVLEEVSTRNTSYNEVMLELIALYNQKAMKGDTASLEQAARAINVLQESGVESRAFYRLIAEFYFTAVQITRASGTLPKITWPDEQMKSLAELSHANERAWRVYLERDEHADRDFIINDRIMSARTWALI